MAEAIAPVVFIGKASSDTVPHAVKLSSSGHPVVPNKGGSFASFTRTRTIAEVVIGAPSSIEGSSVTDTVTLYAVVVS